MLPRIICGWLLCSQLVVFAASSSKGVQAPALQSLADQLDRQLSNIIGQLTSSDPVVGVLVEGDNSIIGKEGRIAQELERLILYRLESGVVVGKAIPVRAGGERSIERARAQGASLLLRCVVGVEKGTIHVTADLTPLHVPFWDRLVDSVPKGASQHFFVSAQADEEIQLLLGKSRAPPPLRSWRMEELLYVDQRVLDVGLGNIDGQAGAELVLLYQEDIEVYTLRDGQPRRLCRHRLNHLPDARIQSRDPAGSLAVADFNRDGQAEIFYKLFDRRVGEVLSWSGSRMRSIRKLERVPLCVYHKGRRAQVVYGTTDPGTNHYQADIEVADINRSTGTSVTLPAPFSTMRCWQSSAGGSPWMVVVDLKGRMLRLNRAWSAKQIQVHVGAGAGLLDLDGDEEPELILSDPAWPGEPDSVRVISRSQLEWQTVEFIGGVVAVAGGDLDGRGKHRAVLVAVEPGEKASRVYLLGR